MARLLHHLRLVEQLTVGVCVLVLSSTGYKQLDNYKLLGLQCFTDISRICVWHIRSFAEDLGRVLAGKGKVFVRLNQVR